RYVRAFFLRTLVFGAVVLTILTTLNYFGAASKENWSRTDAVFWTSFFTLGLSYCSYTVQIIVHDFLSIHGYSEKEGRKAGTYKINLLKLAAKLFCFLSFIAIGAAATFGMLIFFLQTDFAGEMKSAIVVATIAMVCFALVKLLLRRKGY
ncbi:MAG: hypothetical protein K2G80_05460, partial [Bacteroidales bacterium]|nr:hypothetical protein [Bacteroidales bacterium]